MAKTKNIYMAGPLGPMGGGMLRVTDYLIQNQNTQACYGSARMVKLDTRGTGSAAASMLVLGAAIGRVVGDRLTGKVAGVHVNMAERLSIFRKGILLNVSRLIGVPTVLHLHAAQMESHYQSLSPLRRFLIRRVFHAATHVIVLGENSRRFVVERMDVPAERVSIVINGVPAPRLPRRPESAHGKKRILFLANLWERKGAGDLIEAMALCRFDPAEVELLIAGGGDIDLYRAQSTRLGLDAVVHFLGWVEQNRAAELMASADVMILPSHDEGLPLSILEALANSVAVICTPVGEIPTVLDDGVNAVFVNPHDVPGIAAALQKVMDDPALRTRLEAAGRNAYENRFSLEHFSAQVAKVHNASFRLSN